MSPMSFHLLHGADHIDLHKAGWNKDWDNFLINNTTPSASEIDAFRTDLMKNKKYKDILARGTKAADSYEEWGKFPDKWKEAARTALKNETCVKSSGTNLRKGGKVIVPVTFCYNCFTGRVEAAVKGAVADELWSLPEIADAVGKEIGDSIEEHGKAGRLNRAIQGSIIDDLASGKLGAKKLRIR